VVAGQEAVFTDASCLDPGAGLCEVPTSWRWDFGTQSLPTPPDASGSGEQNPSYVFPEAGTYTVTMLARLADLESEFILPVTVIESPVAAFSITVPAAEPYSPGLFTFDSGTSTSAGSDTIIGLDWDFGGFGAASDDPNPSVMILNTGDFDITLTVTTSSGQTDTVVQTISVVTLP
jgi:PKD repeat protein